MISSEHLLPSEILENSKSVIVYFIPFKKDIVRSNSKGICSSKEWAEAYVLTTQMIVKLNRFLSEKIQKMGFKMAEIPPTHNFDKDKLISNWSHKHVAYIAGLGKFGLRKMIITEKGCCGRLGSIVTDLKLKPTNRPDNEFCLYFHDKSCIKCVEKCPFGALGINKFDRKKCYQICLSNAELHSKMGYADVCGKCLSIVPCSLRNPVIRGKKD
jgi:epoxyqueuosine reductase QueG